MQSADEYLYSSFNARYGKPEEAIVPIDLEFWWEDDEFEIEDSGD